MTGTATIAPIVEGHGEISAVRSLVTRIASELCGTWVEVAQPFRLDSAKMRKPDELERAVRVQAARVDGRGGVLVLRDGDDRDVDCPVDLARELVPAPDLVRPPVEVVIAVCEYEAWFLAAADSLRSHPAVRDDAAPPDEPERIRDAKVRVQSMMHESYKETLHQVGFTSVMDLRAAEEKCRSFRRMIQAVQVLIT